MSKCGNYIISNDHNSITQCRITIKFGRYVKETSIQGTMKADFSKYALNLNYIAKLPDWSVTGCHGNHINNSASQCPAYQHPTHTTQVWCQSHFLFCSYDCLSVQPIRGPVWLPWQPESNIANFLKLLCEGFHMVYDFNVSPFGNITKIDLKDQG